MGPETKIFPFREITKNENAILRTLVGDPDAQRELVDRAVDICGRPALRMHPQLLQFMKEVRGDVLDTLGASSGRAWELFSGGALIYTSVFEVLSNSAGLPIRVDAVEDMRAVDTVEFMFQTPDILRKTSSAFCDLLDRVMPVFEEGAALGSLAYMGAGAVNLAVLQSINYAQPSSQPYSEVLQFLEQDPEMTYLSDRMQELGENDA